MEFRDFFIMALVFGLALIALFTFSSSLSSYYGSSVNVNQEYFLNKTIVNISSTINNSGSEVQGQWNAYVSETQNPVTTALGFVFNSVLSAGIVFKTIITSAFFAFFSMIGNSFNTPIVIITIGVITTIILGLIILMIWSLIRAGR